MIELRPFQHPRRRRPRLARRSAPLLVRRLPRSRRGPTGASCACGTTTRSPPSAGFPPHPHRDMEIITYVRKGAITHQDSLGNTGRTEAGDVQVMSAGTGVTHSEYNLEDEATQIFQIWIIPDQRGGEPSWGAQPFPKDDRAGRFVTLASGIAGDEGSLPIRAEARVLGATVKAGDVVAYDTAADRHLYLVPATGKVRVGDVEVNARDGAAITGLSRIEVTALEDSELVLVDAR